MGDILNEYSEADALIKKIVQRIGMREQAIKALTGRTSRMRRFSGLDGLAESTGMELEVIWQGLIDSRRQCC